jgi:agmatine deiminase
MPLPAPMPAEWSPQQAMFLGFPSHAALWEADLVPAQAEVAALVRQLSETVPVRLMVATECEMAGAERMLAGTPRVELHAMPFGDVWLRDTGPVFTAAQSASAFAFNGWGGKYRLPHDDAVAGRIANLVGAELSRFALVFEGGALDVDGQGLGITTEQCLLNPNRNPGLSKGDVEAVLRETLGVRRLIWLGEGLAGDHTDGHVDNLARFAAPGTVLIPEPAGPDDPNAEAYRDAWARAQAANLVVLQMPSPGRFERDGRVMPASYMNFLIANRQVVVPLYGQPNDEVAVRALARAFPRHRVTGLPSVHLLSGGGSFHCISQQQPA